MWVGTARLGLARTQFPSSRIKFVFQGTKVHSFFVFFLLFHSGPKHKNRVTSDPHPLDIINFISRGSRLRAPTARAAFRIRANSKNGQLGVLRSVIVLPPGYASRRTTMGYRFGSITTVNLNFCLINFAFFYEILMDVLVFYEILMGFLLFYDFLTKMNFRV